MNILCFKEGSKLLPEDLKNQIASKTQMDVTDILKKLELAHVLKHRLPKMDVGEINLEEEIEKFEDKEYYSFKYVGILMINDLFLIIYPKYIRDVKKDFYGDKHKLLQIMQVIDKYQSVYTYDTDSEENLGSFLALQIKIIREYFNAGLYSTDEVIMELNGEGPTSWEQTINENIAYLVDDIPFYFDIFTQKKILK